MILRSIEDKLREEYFELFPIVSKLKDQLEAEVRFRLIPILNNLSPHERFEVSTRVKDCESAINALRRRQEGSLFDKTKPQLYSLTQLKDLAGARVLVFPRGLINTVNSCLMEYFGSWEPDHIPGYGESDEYQALKYHGFIQNEKVIRCEIQIVPMLTGLFWKVEHEAIYKPKPEFKNIAESYEMKERTQNVLNALKEFEEMFEKLCNTPE